MKFFLGRSALCLLLFAAALLGGCGRNTPARPDPASVLAKINNFELTVSDFLDERGMALAGAYAGKDLDKYKKSVLDEIINKKILVQEAQKEDLDKRKDFMREIERYWEQSLIKLLVRKKSYEISRGITVESHEMLDEYKRMRRRVDADFVILDGRAAADKLAASGENFDSVKEGLVSAGSVAEDKTDWWIAGDLPEALEGALFAAAPGENAGPVEFDGKWVVFRVTGEEYADIGTFDSMKNELRNRVASRKKEQKLREWIDGLREKASIKINKNVLDGIKPGDGQ